jgi:hypothetical protein
MPDDIRLRQATLLALLELQEAVDQDDVEGAQQCREKRLLLTLELFNARIGSGLRRCNKSGMSVEDGCVTLMTPIRQSRADDLEKNSGPSLLGANVDKGAIYTGAWWLILFRISATSSTDRAVVDLVSCRLGASAAAGMGPSFSRSGCVGCSALARVCLLAIWTSAKDLLGVMSGTLRVRQARRHSEACLLRRSQDIVSAWRIGTSTS